MERDLSPPEGMKETRVTILQPTIAVPLTDSLSPGTNSMQRKVTTGHDATHL